MSTEVFKYDPTSNKYSCPRCRQLVIDGNIKGKDMLSACMAHLDNECEWLHNLEQAKEEWRLERSFNGTGE